MFFFETNKHNTYISTNLIFGVCYPPPLLQPAPPPKRQLAMIVMSEEEGKWLELELEAVEADHQIPAVTQINPVPAQSNSISTQPVRPQSAFVCQCTNTLPTFLSVEAWWVMDIRHIHVRRVAPPDLYEDESPGYNASTYQSVYRPRYIPENWPNTDHCRTVESLSVALCA